jgi:methylmalonyl-CoA mutase N-terminal domain/subunit
VQELAFTFANAMEYVKRAIDAGLAGSIVFAPRLSFFFAAHNDLFEEVAKFRAARRLYARLMRDRFGANDASARLRFHTQTGGVTLQAQQPQNNIVRRGRPRQWPRCSAARSAAYERVRRGARPSDGRGGDAGAPYSSRSSPTNRGVALTADPLGGSYYVEHLTNDARALRARADRAGRCARRRGGRDRASFFQEEIARSAYEFRCASSAASR